MVEAKTKGRPPEQPPSFQFITTNSSQATLYLNQWESGGCDITHFTIQYRKVGMGHWTTSKNYDFFYFYLYIVETKSFF